MCRGLRVDPRPVLLSIVFASNIGGTATLIGDPPNILIGSAAHFSFMDFVRHLTPIAAADVVLMIALSPVIFRSWFRSYSSAGLGSRPRASEIDKPLLKRVLTVLTIVISLFLLEDALGYPPSIPAIIGAAITLILVRDRISLEDALNFVDWPTLIFFVFMFVAIRGVERLGVMDFIAGVISSVAPNLPLAMMVVLWVSALLSAFVDNIPFVMSMIPVIERVASALGTDSMPLYWALALGGCLGGNGTLIGASANIVVAGIAEKHGYHIPFKWFMRFGMPTMIATVGAAALYLILRYGL